MASNSDDSSDSWAVTRVRPSSKRRMKSNCNSGCLLFEPCRPPSLFAIRKHRIILTSMHDCFNYCKWMIKWKVHYILLWSMPKTIKWRVRMTSDWICCLVCTGCCETAVDLISATVRDAPCGILRRRKRIQSYGIGYSYSHWQITPAVPVPLVFTTTTTAMGILLQVAVPATAPVELQAEVWIRIIAVRALVQ